MPRRYKHRSRYKNDLVVSMLDYFQMTLRSFGNSVAFGCMHPARTNLFGAESLPLMHIIHELFIELREHRGLMLQYIIRTQRWSYKNRKENLWLSTVFTVERGVARSFWNRAAFPTIFFLQVRIFYSFRWPLRKVQVLWTFDDLSRISTRMNSFDCKHLFAQINRHLHKYIETHTICRLILTSIWRRTLIAEFTHVLV